MEVVWFALTFHNRRWERSMTKNLTFCILGYKCGARPELAWMRDHPKAVVDVSSLSKTFGQACQGRVTYIAQFCYSCPWRSSWMSLELVHFLTPSTSHKKMITNIRNFPFGFFTNHNIWSFLNNSSHFEIGAWNFWYFNIENKPLAFWAPYISIKSRFPFFLVKYQYMRRLL